MKYLITAPPILLDHGIYHYRKITKEEALHWFEAHHKELKVATVTANPKQQGGFQIQPTFRFVELLAAAVDRYVAQQNHTLSNLTEHDEVLVIQSQQRGLVNMCVNNSSGSTSRLPG